jgi:hypothetical protein
VVGVDVLGELGLPKLPQPPIEMIDLPGLGSRLQAEAAQSVYHRRGLSQQGEVVQAESIIPETADDLPEVAGVDQHHRGDDRPVMSGQRHAEQFPHGMPPGRDVLPAALQGCGQHAAHAEADVRGVADDAARQPLSVTADQDLANNGMSTCASGLPHPVTGSQPGAAW